MKVLNYGSLNVDYVYSVDHIIVGGETQHSSKLEVFSGGKGLNQSIALAKAGVPVYHAGIVGTDGDILLEACKEAGVNTIYIRRLPVKGGHTMIQVDKNAQNCIILYGGTNQMQTKEFVDEVLADFGEGDYLILQNEINMVGEIIRLSHEKGCRVVFNASPIPKNPEELPLELVDIFMVNELEAAALAGTSTDGDFRDILKALQKKYPKAAIVMTLGKEGVLYGYKEEFYSHPIFKVNAVDTTAAGDTFCGYFLAALCAGKSVEMALREASAASAMAVSAKGAAPSIPVHSAMEEWLRGRS